MTGKWTLALALGVIGGSASVASAELVAYDPFLSGDDRAAGEYTAGQDIRTMGAAAHGWVGTSGIDGFGVAYATPPGKQSTVNYQANATGDNVTAVDYEQGGRLNWIGVGNFPANRDIARQLNPTPSSSEWYFSVITNRLGWANSTTNTYAVGGFVDANGNGLQVGYDDTDEDAAFVPNLVLRLGGENRVLLLDAPSSAAQYVLVKLTVNTSGNDTVDVWVDPDTLTTSTPADITYTDVNVSDSLTPFTQSYFASPGQSGPVFWDEIRLGTTFEAVTGIPEPASLALVAMGGLAMLRRRNR